MGNGTWTLKKVGSLGNLKCMIGDYTLSSSYATGGDTATPGLFGLNEILWAEFDSMPSGIKLDYIKVSPQSGPTTANTVKAWFPTGGGGTVPTTLINPTITSGATAVTGSAAVTPNMNPGVSVEVGSGANLSAIVGRLLLFGY